jgi:HlyD family secretion protein
MAKQKSATRRILTIGGALVGVLVLLIAGLFWLGFLGGGESGISVQTAEVERRDVTQTVTAFGSVQPEREVVISPDVPGEIITLTVQEGDRVERGELLARVEAKDYVAQAQQQRAGVSQARANLQGLRADSTQARQQFERQKNLFEREIASRQAFEGARARYEQAVSQLRSARFSVDQARARFQESQEQVRQTAIYAPITGTVSRLSVEEGERVVGTDRQPGTEMMRIARLEQMEVEVDVNENDVVNVNLDDTASVEVDAYPERTFKGIVTEIANSARVSGQGTQEQVTNFPVKIRMLSPHNMELRPQSSSAAPADAARADTAGPGLQEQETTFTAESVPTFRPGMNATVDISTHTVPGAIAVPIQAVTVRDFNEVQPRADSTSTQGGNGAQSGRQKRSNQERAQGEDLRKVVFLVEDGKARMSEVQTGISDATHIRVLSGLEPGKTIITGPYGAVSRTLRPGMTVRTESGGRRGGRGGPSTASRE